MSRTVYVVRQRGGWGVEFDGLVRSGHASREAALRCARERCQALAERGLDPVLKVQGERGLWLEDRSFAAPACAEPRLIA